MQQVLMILGGTLALAALIIYLAGLSLIFACLIGAVGFVALVALIAMS